MLKISTGLLVATLMLHMTNADLLSDILNGDALSSGDSSVFGLDVLSTLLKPNQSMELKVAEIIVKNALRKLTSQGQEVNLSVDNASSLDVGEVFTINASLTDSADKMQNCKVTIWVHHLTRTTDYNFECDGQSAVVKHLTW